MVLDHKSCFVQIVLCPIGNCQCLQPAWIMNIVLFQYIVDMAGFFFQYIDMKIYFNDSSIGKGLIYRTILLFVCVEFDGNTSNGVEIILNEFLPKK